MCGGAKGRPGSTVAAGAAARASHALNGDRLFIKSLPQQGSPDLPSRSITRHASRTLGAHASALPPSGDASCRSWGSRGELHFQSSVASRAVLCLALLPNACKGASSRPDHLSHLSDDLGKGTRVIWRVFAHVGPDGGCGRAKNEVQRVLVRLITVCSTAQLCQARPRPMAAAQPGGLAACKFPPSQTHTRARNHAVHEVRVLEPEPGAQHASVRPGGTGGRADTQQRWLTRQRHLTGTHTVMCAAGHEL